MRIQSKTLLVSAALTCMWASTTQADLSPYSQDFEALDMTDPAALTTDGWMVFGNVFDGTNGNYLYGYGPFPAPNGGPAFSAVASGEGGPPQGTQQLVTYSDYNNGDHAMGNVIESNVFQEQIVGAADVGKTFTFTFDAKLGDLVPNSTALGFIKVLDNVTFQLSAYETVDMTTTPTTWSTYSLSTTIAADQVGHFFQIGFLTTSTNFTPSGIFYDNVNFGDGGGSGTGTALCFGDGNDAPCGCSNEIAGTSGGCGNSLGVGAILSAAGTADTTADTVTLSCSGVRTQPGLFFQANNTIGGGTGITFGDGIRCCGMSVVRLEIVVAPGPEPATADMTVSITGSGPAGTVNPGDKKCYQFWYRDPGTGNPCGAGNFNLSNAVSITWS